MSICLPGDFIPSEPSDGSSFVIKKDGQNVSTVLGIVGGDSTFEPLRKDSVIPKVHDVIIGRVIRTKRKEAHLVILTANDKPLRSQLLAELRSVDVAEKDVDNIIVSEFCKPGDLVKARIVALGRSGFYAQLSTAEEGMGVQVLVDNTESEQK